MISRSAKNSNWAKLKVTKQCRWLYAPLGKNTVLLVIQWFSVSLVCLCSICLWPLQCLVS